MVDGYTQTYDANELSEVITDNLVGTGVVVFDFNTILGLGVVLAIFVFLLGYAGIRMRR